MRSLNSSASQQQSLPPPVLGAFMLSRFVQDTALRAPLPFLGVIAAAYEQDIATISWLAVALTLAAVAAPFTSLLGQRFGQRQMLLYPLLLFVMACLALTFAPSFGSVIALFIIMGIAGAMYNPQVQAFVAERVPIERRGTVVGILELSWALSFILGAPVFGLLVERVAWSAPFALLALLGCLATVATWFIVKPLVAQPQTPAAFSFASWRLVWQQRPARLFWVFTFGIKFAAQIPWLIYPQWMKSHFHLNNVELGLVSAVIGFADVVAEVLIIAYLDQINKRAAIIGAGSLYALAFVAFWLLSGQLIGMMIALFCLYLAFEVTIVASIAVASEVVPQARAAMMGFNTAAGALGSISSALLVLALFANDRFWLVALVACASISLSLVFFATATRQLAK
jgi:predicted MFS family arabinose efflux permease